MSRTLIQGITKNGEVVEGSTSNAWRGAMALWNHVAQKYCGKEIFPTFFDQEGQQKVLSMWQDKTLPYEERVALLSTMDGALVKFEELPKLFELFKKVGNTLPDSSYTEQAKIIDELSKNEEVIAVGWNQTSVVDSRWEVVDEEGRVTAYDIENGDNHFFVFDDLEGE